MGKNKNKTHKHFFNHIFKPSLMNMADIAFIFPKPKQPKHETENSHFHFNFLCYLMNETKKGTSETTR